LEGKRGTTLKQGPEWKKRTKSSVGRNDHYFKSKKGEDLPRARFRGKEVWNRRGG